MTRRNTQLVLLCEDKQHEAFARRFLKKYGWNNRRLRVEIAPPGSGSAEQFVRENYVSELKSYRSKRRQVTQALVVVIDGDRCGIEGRLQQLSQACEEAGIAPRSDDERVLVAVPTWSIETWLAFLDGQDVTETVAYPRLGRERECQRHVELLAEMCRQAELRSPAPPSLVAACAEFNSRLGDL